MNTLSSHSDANKRLSIAYMTKILSPQRMAEMTSIELFEYMLDNNIITGTNIVELAMVQGSHGNLELCPHGRGRDFTDDTDAKTATVFHKVTTQYDKKYDKHRDIDRYCAVIGGANKIGGLRVVVYNPFASREHFLYIPKELVAGAKTVELTFDPETWEIKGKYSKCEFESFDEICKPVKELLERFGNLYSGTMKTLVFEAFDKGMTKDEARDHALNYFPEGNPKTINGYYSKARLESTQTETSIA